MFLHIFVSFSPNRACDEGVLTVLLKGPLMCYLTRARCRRAFCIVIYSTSWHLPPKTHRKIDILKELLHFSWEGLQFWMVSSFLEPAGFLKPQGAPQCLSDASQVLLRCFKNSNFGYESGPHGSPRHDTLSQRSATPPPSFLSPSQAPETQFLTPKSKKSWKSEKLQNFRYFPVWGPTLGSYL